MGKNKFCSHCGAELNEGAAFCSQCGSTINSNHTNLNSQNIQYSQSNLNNQNVNKDPNAKSKMVAGILGILLGGLGVHNFYLGYTSKGLTQLLISVLSIFILAPISAIWGFIEGVMILTGNISTDAEGRKLVD